MVKRKITAIAFIAILIIAWLVVFITRVEAQTTDEQIQTLIGEWHGIWYPGRDWTTLIIHEIDTAKAKARCTYTSSSRGEKKYPVLADFTPGPTPKLIFKVEMADFQFVLKNKVLHGTFRGISARGHNVVADIKMEKEPKK